MVKVAPHGTSTAVTYEHRNVLRGTGAKLPLAVGMHYRPNALSSEESVVDYGTTDDVDGRVSDRVESVMLAVFHSHHSSPRDSSK